MRIFLIDRRRCRLAVCCGLLIGLLGINACISGDIPHSPLGPLGDDVRSDETAGVELLAGAAATGFVDGIGPDALFNGIGGAVVLPDGSAILATDTFNATLRRISLPSGETRTVAGRVQAQTTVDGVGLQARFQSPRAIALSRDGSTAYLADGPTLRRVRLSGYEVQTLAGTAGMPGYVDGRGESVRLGFLLHALALSDDERSLFIADRSNRVLRRLDLQTLEVSTLAGSAYSGANQSSDGIGNAARFSGLGGLVVRGDMLYVLDTFNHTLRRVQISTQEVRTVLGVAGMAGLQDGDAAAARLRSPQGLCQFNDSLLSVSFDGVLRSIRLLDFQVTTLLGQAGDARSVDGQGAQVRLGIGFASPTILGDRLMYLDRSANSIRPIELSTLRVSTLAGPVEPEANRDGSRHSARFTDPAALSASRDGQILFVSDATAGCIRAIDRGLGIVRTLAGRCGTPGSSDGSPESAQFESPRGLVLDEERQTLYIADADGATVRAIDLRAGAVPDRVRTLVGQAGQAEARDGDQRTARFVRPVALALDTQGQRLYVADVASPGSVPSAPDGYAALRTVDLASGQVQTVAGGKRASPPQDGPISTASFHSPVALAFDPDADALFLAESGAAIVRVLRISTGQVQTLAGKAGETGPADGAFADARFDSPNGLAWSRSQRALFVSDAGGHSIRRLDLVAGRVRTWLGDPSQQGGLPAGRRTPWAQATLYYPSAPLLLPDARSAVAVERLAYISEGAIYLAIPSARLP